MGALKAVLAERMEQLVAARKECKRLEQRVTELEERLDELEEHS